MHKRAKIIGPILLLAIIGGILWHTMRGREAAPAGTLAGNGVIEATEVDVSAKATGRLLTLTVQEGDDVQPGQLIATLDSGEVQGQTEQAKANLLAAQEELSALQTGTRPEEIRQALAQHEAAVRALEQAEARRDLVKAGPRKEQVAQLRAAYEQAQQRLSLVKEGPRKEQVEQISAALSQAEVTLADAETELQRAERLFKEGAIAEQRVDQARTRRDVAQTQVNAARQRLAEVQIGARPQEIREAEAAAEIAHQRLLEAQSGARPEELRQAEAQVAQAREQVNAAQATLDLAQAGPRPEAIAAAKARVEGAKGVLMTAQSSLSQATVVAPSAGRVTTRSAEPGELITPGMPIIRIADLSTVWLRIYVPEPQIGLVKAGQRAEVTTDSGSRYQGRVVEIAETPEFTPKNVQTKDERVKLVFGVKVEVDNPDGSLKPGMPGDAVVFTK